MEKDCNRAAVNLSARYRAFNEMWPNVSFLSASGLSWSTPTGDQILAGVSVTVARERLGLVGRNGVGKSTLLHLLAGDIQPTSGAITKSGVVSLMRQSVQPALDQTIADLFGKARDLEILQRSELGTASLEELAEADWTLADRMVRALARLHLNVGPDTPLKKLSGGQRTRAALAAAIFEDPDVLLLDEPTNNLDGEGRDAVRQLVRDWPAGLVVVSHDRELLESVDAIVELTSLGAARYGGNWSFYRERKALELAAAESDLAHARKERAKVDQKAKLAAERQIRRDAAGSRKGARGDMPRILAGARKNAAQSSAGGNARLQDRLAEEAADAVAAAQAKIEVLQSLSISLPSSGLSNDRRVLDLRAVSAGYDGERAQLKDVNFSVVGPERIGITGSNGAGKTTLLRVIAGQIQPLSGEVTRAGTSALIDQHVSFLEPSATVLGNFMRLNPGADENYCRSILAGFLFRSDDALQTVASLSGGQMLRCGLACRLGGKKPPALLILDEPTNHLDLDSVHAVEEALLAFDGALIVVSHDETFLDAISVNRRLNIANGRLSEGLVTSSRTA